MTPAPRGDHPAARAFGVVVATGGLVLLAAGAVVDDRVARVGVGLLVVYVAVTGLVGLRRMWLRRPAVQAAAGIDAISGYLGDIAAVFDHAEDRDGDS